MTARTDHAELRQDLLEIRDRAGKVLRRERRREARLPALELGLLCALCVPVGYLAYLGVAHGLGFEATVLPAAFLIGLTLGMGLACSGIHVLGAGSRRVPAGAALALVDTRRGLADRLQTAAEFLRRSERSSFMEAALLDAQGFARHASSEAIPGATAPPRSWFRARLYGGALLLLLLAAIWVPASERTLEFEGTANVIQAGMLSPAGERTKEEPEEQPVSPQAEQESPEPERLPGRRTRARKGRKDSRLGAELKKTRGALGSGQSADAASAAGASQARGAASSQAQASLGARKPARTKKRQKRKPKKPDSPPPPVREPEEDSGATAGRGAASGSNRSPSASPWASKDQVTSDDEEDLEEDEEVDDEFDNSDARGGVQPHLRDRRPPVNRDLGIGFGNMKNPDANGRGGPSELKKSRGVAALVLGVPIPDHVKGQPGPGKTKITQERVEPEAEDAAAVEATARRPREAPVGHLDRPELEAWMRELLRSYYRIIRRQNPDKPEKPEDSQSPAKKPGD